MSKDCGYSAPNPIEFKTTDVGIVNKLSFVADKNSKKADIGFSAIVCIKC